MRDDVATIPDVAPSTPQPRLLETSDPVLSWLIFTGATLLAFVLLWFYGLAHKALTSDPTHITLVIWLIYIAASLHCLWRAQAISREAAAERSLAQAIAGLDAQRLRADRDPVSATANDPLNAGLVAAHIRDLTTKAGLAGEGRLDQTILLRVLAERLSGTNSFGAFASDLLMKLGLFGTIVGFIMMLAPIAGMNTEDQSAIKSSMALMSEGMAVAMYTTLAGLVASILIKVQYQFVETATAKLFTSAVALTEVYVLPSLERRTSPAQ
jgi:biopolymer transport protein ExbB/TolQ